MLLRVGLNATCFNERPSGAKQRFLGIYGALTRRRQDIEFVVYEPTDCRVGRWFEGVPNVTARVTPFPSTRSIRKSLHALLYWRHQARRDRIDLFEQFHLPLVNAPKCPTLLTIHDIRSVLADVPPLKRALYAGVLHRSIAAADHIVTVSETMRGDIQAFHPSAGVSTIYNGIDAAHFRERRSAPEEARQRLGLPKNFILAVGHLEARKNYLQLIRALAALRDGGRDVSLVIVGNYGVQDDREREIREEIAALGLIDRVRLLKEVSNKELADLYALCTIVAFPSTYEGFGIPVLEAMAAGRPIILSDIPVFRELTEGRGVYFKPNDTTEMATTIAGVLSSPARQSDIVAYGEQRVRAFSFLNLAAQVERLYESLL